MLTKLLSSVMHLPPLVYVMVALTSILYLKTRRKVPRNIPPFPTRPYPIVGHLPMLKDGPNEVFKNWKKSTGDIFSLYMGSKLLVVMNSYPVLKEAFVKHADIFSDRPASFISEHLPGGVLGIVGSSGANWKEQRSVSLSILRSFGMGKNFLAEKINEEIAYYLQAMSDLKGEPTDLQLFTNTSVSNIICAILVGNRFEYDDPYFTKLLKLINENVAFLGQLQLLSTYPWLRYLPGDPFGASKYLQNGREIRSHFCAKFMKETKDEEGGMDNFINAYYNEMNKKQKTGVPTNLDEDNLMAVVSNLFLAGTETTSTTLLWAMLFGMHFPETQKKLYDEIVDVIGTERRPTMQDKTHMHYTNAYILETLRYACIAPNSMPHLCNADVEIAGYTIPKGTSVLANLSGILLDDELWGDPMVFRPDRFFGKNNDVTSPEEFIPFSLGRRYCVGESMARMELFLFVTGIFQRFEVRAEDPDNLPSLKPRLGVANAPQRFKLRLIERN